MGKETPINGFRRMFLKLKTPSERQTAIEKISLDDFLDVRDGILEDIILLFSAYELDSEEDIDKLLQSIKDYTDGEPFMYFLSDFEISEIDKMTSMMLKIKGNLQTKNTNDLDSLTYKILDKLEYLINYIASENDTIEMKYYTQNYYIQ